MCVCVYVCMCICVYVCMCVCVYVVLHISLFFVCIIYVRVCCAPNPSSYIYMGPTTQTIAQKKHCEVILILILILQKQRADAGRAKRLSASPEGDHLTLLNVFNMYMKSTSKKGARTYAVSRHWSMRTYADIHKTKNAPLSGLILWLYPLPAPPLNNNAACTY